MKVLISAYGCEPGKGSEQGIGWNWSIAVANRGHEVWVITRRNNREIIEAFFSRNEKVGGLHFVYYDLPPAITKLKPYMGLYIYYEMWQRGIISVAKSLDKEIDFDIVHHLTFGVFRQNTFLYKLGKPLYIGPLGGGEYIPAFLKKTLSFRNRVFEKVRDLANKLSLYNPYLEASLQTAKKIYVRTNETLGCFPAKYRHKIKVSNDIGAFESDIVNSSVKKHERAHFKILFVGRLVHWKGPHLALKAFHKFHSAHPDSSFTLIGDGGFKNYLKQFVSTHKLHESVHFIDKLPQDRVFLYYKDSDVFLFPSLHEAGGSVMYEAMSFGVPVVTLKINSSALIFGDTTETSLDISTATSEEQVVDLLYGQLCRLYADEIYYQAVSKKMLLKANEFCWRKIVGFVYDEIEEIEYVHKKPAIPKPQ